VTTDQRSPTHWSVSNYYEHLFTPEIGTPISTGSCYSGPGDRPERTTPVWATRRRASTRAPRTHTAIPRNRRSQQIDWRQ